jgi:hypothetical protein
MESRVEQEQGQGVGFGQARVRVACCAKAGEMRRFTELAPRMPLPLASLHHRHVNHPKHETPKLNDVKDRGSRPSTWYAFAWPLVLVLVQPLQPLLQLCPPPPLISLFLSVPLLALLQRNHLLTPVM